MLLIRNQKPLERTGALPEGVSDDSARIAPESARNSGAQRAVFNGGQLNEITGRGEPLPVREIDLARCRHDGRRGGVVGRRGARYVGAAVL
jgi:hypothetical protein